MRRLYRDSEFDEFIQAGCYGCIFVRTRSLTLGTEQPRLFATLTSDTDHPPHPLDYIGNTLTRREEFQGDVVKALPCDNTNLPPEFA